MAARLPVFRPAGWVERKAWAPRSGQLVKRKRGRAGQKARAEVLSREPFCRECAKAGRERKADQVDHIVPLAWGGSDEIGNKQPLCLDCHIAKSERERSLSHPGRSR